jgi:hypothetical protein
MRSNSGAPISSSSLMICRLTAEEATLSWRAASRIDLARRTASK